MIRLDHTFIEHLDLDEIEFYKNLVFGCAKRMRIFYAIFPSNHRGEV